MSAILYSLESGPAWRPCPPLVMAQRQADFRIKDRALNVIYRVLSQDIPTDQAFEISSRLLAKAIIEYVASTVVTFTLKSLTGGNTIGGGDALIPC